MRPVDWKVSSSLGTIRTSRATSRRVCSTELYSGLRGIQFQDRLLDIGVSKHLATHLYSSDDSHRSGRRAACHPEVRRAALMAVTSENRIPKLLALSSVAL